jgi:hypothetical protein
MLERLGIPDLQVGEDVGGADELWKPNRWSLISLSKERSVCMSYGLWSLMRAISIRPIRESRFVLFLRFAHESIA